MMYALTISPMELNAVYQYLSFTHFSFDRIPPWVKLVPLKAPSKSPIKSLAPVFPQEKPASIEMTVR